MSYNPFNSDYVKLLAEKKRALAAEGQPEKPLKAQKIETPQEEDNHNPKSEDNLVDDDIQNNNITSGENNESFDVSIENIITLDTGTLGISFLVNHKPWHGGPKNERFTKRSINEVKQIKLDQSSNSEDYSIIYDVKLDPSSFDELTYGNRSSFNRFLKSNTYHGCAEHHKKTYKEDRYNHNFCDRCEDEAEETKNLFKLKLRFYSDVSPNESFGLTAFTDVVEQKLFKAVLGFNHKDLFRGYSDFLIRKLKTQVIPHSSDQVFDIKIKTDDNSFFGADVQEEQLSKDDPVIDSISNVLNDPIIETPPQISEELKKPGISCIVNHKPWHGGPKHEWFVIRTIEEVESIKIEPSFSSEDKYSVIYDVKFDPSSFQDLKQNKINNFLNENTYRGCKEHHKKVYKKGRYEYEYCDRCEGDSEEVDILFKLKLGFLPVNDTDLKNGPLKLTAFTDVVEEKIFNNIVKEY
ncbi:hypothetical protein BN7_6335 [Wickerhamomyces ciferrii]|uniref:Uncharacterized protein n=1 Tax=Wickerhamomyces ciferrii (strain ATCC 14091 / BCRC 22168 / CBS 111 / JCM 3599 / NBRC 0793 / NRRL Y-1031 F-60-10) TaxID=1206466 RepID=K0KXH3_WICCF|nr:uncharacterized protein BN7_6335 [Wickerhamomyces ciferrii]CCH46737.1 hypothetical protein BN7_6335 [Wickerhamomyces ciferrii]